MEDINEYLTQNSEFNVESLIQHIYSKMPKKLSHQRIHYKKYSEDNLVQIFTETAREHTQWPIFNICRSMIFDEINNKIVSYSHPNIEYLEYSLELIQKQTPEQTFTESHEGTLISVFYHNNKWYYATRRHIDMYQTNQIINGVKSDTTHGQMFEDALSKVNLTKESFELLLNTKYTYNLELVHHQNKFNISYESRFGEKYAKLFLLFVRDENQMNIVSSNLNMFNTEVLDKSTIITHLGDNTRVMEGFIFNQDNHICKVMHPNYSNIMKFNPGFKTKQEQYLYLYQNNLLNEYIGITNNKMYIESESGDSIELVGIVACVFTYVGQRMLDIYYTFNNNNMVHRNEDKFKELFNSKKYYLIFHTLGMMKGIHKNKQLDINVMRTFLKYKITATNMWKLFHEIRAFEDNENLLNKWMNLMVKMF
jgi:hypothetical protein